jgi:transposase InsO family protein
MRSRKSLPPPSAIDDIEEFALHRLQVIGALLGRDFEHGELRAELRKLAVVRWRPPAAANTRTYSIPTLERWYYAYLAGGLAGLRYQQRSDKGRGRALTWEQQQLLLDIRSDHPTASASTIIDCLVRSGTVDAGVLTVSTVNRFFSANGVPRRARNGTVAAEGHRLRWEAQRPGLLWHSDVCHGPTLTSSNGQTHPIRIHAILDDASRHVVALEVHTREREEEMLGLFARALLRTGKPQTLYLDNGATYSGEGLKTVCARLGVKLVHAAPYDPQARGKMERFWRTLREQCLDFISATGTPHDVQVRLNAWLDERYCTTPHSGLFGMSPRQVWQQDNTSVPVTSTELKEAFWTCIQRKVRNDSTLSIDGVTYQVDAGYLAGKQVDIVFFLPPLDVDYPPHVRFEDRLLPLHAVSPKQNDGVARHPSAPTPQPRQPRPDLNPADVLLNDAAGRLKKRSSN